MSDKPSLLVIPPASLDDATRARIAEAGVLVVESASPEDVRLLSPEPLPLSGDDMFFAALGSIVAAGDWVSAHYVKALHKQMLVNREARTKSSPGIVRGPGGRFQKADAA